jgi:hypothetical protein
MIAEPGTARNAVFYIKRITGALLLVALAFTFIYSAYTKSGVEFKGFYLAETPDSSNAFDSFQWTFLELGINNIMVAGILARLMVGFELMLGLFLLLHIYLRQFTYKAIIAILGIFIIYLLLVLAKQGNSGNCGCFGNKITMKPLTAIWKNVAMIAVTIILMFIYRVRPYKHQEYIAMVVGMGALTIPFLVNNIYTGTAPVKVGKPIDLNPLYKFSPTPNVELRKGKHIVAFMSLTCPHCKKAAYLMQIIHKEHPEIPMFIVVDGPEDYKKEFFDETHAEGVPHLFYRHNDEFTQMAGPEVPAVYWVNNGVIEYQSKYAYYQLDPSFMLKWVKK